MILDSFGNLPRQFIWDCCHYPLILQVLSQKKSNGVPLGLHFLVFLGLLLGSLGGKVRRHVAGNSKEEHYECQQRVIVGGVAKRHSKAHTHKRQDGSVARRWVMLCHVSGHKEGGQKRIVVPTPSKLVDAFRQLLHKNGIHGHPEHSVVD